MNRLSSANRTAILRLMVEGVSIRSIARAHDVSPNTIDKLLRDAERACFGIHDQEVRDVAAERIQTDEVWSFCDAKQRNVAAAKAAPPEAGDVWTCIAMDPDSKLIVSWFVGDRSTAPAGVVMADLKVRLANRVQLTTDGHSAYLEGVEDAFGDDVDFAQLVKATSSLRRRGRRATARAKSSRPSRRGSPARPIPATSPPPSWNA